MVSGQGDSLLEREGELAQLGATVQQVGSGAGAMIVVEGPAGIGKTRLLEATRELAVEAGLDVLSARPGELEQELGWGVVRELFEPALRALSRAQRDAVLGGAARLALPTLGRPGETTLPTGAEGLAAALHGLYWLTANLSERGPLLIAVDDAHWADEPSLRWLAYMAARVADLPLALVITARPGEPGATPDVVGSLGSRRSTVVVRPAPLSPTATSECVSGALRGRAEGEFCRACHDATGGNPFLLGELLRELASADVVPVDVNSDLVRTASPERIARAALERIARLEPDAVELATAVAVLGANTPLGHAAMLAGLDEQAAARAADRLAEVDVLRPGLPLEFVHPLVRTAVYERQPKAQVTLRHAQAARLLVECGGQDDAIAVHLLAVDPAGDVEVTVRLRRAAELAFARGAPYVAASYLRRALAEPPPAAERPALMYRLGQAETAAMGPAGLDTLEAALDLCKEPAERAAIAIEFSRAARMVADFPRATHVLERVIDSLEPGTPLATRIDGELINVAFLDVETNSAARVRLERYSDPALRDGLQDPGILADLAIVELAGAATPREVPLDFARRAIAALDPQAPDPSAIVYAGCALLYCDEFEQARALWDLFIAAARGTGSALAYGFGTCFRAQLSHRVGDIREAEEDARASVAIHAEWGTRTVQPEIFLAEALIERGALPEAVELLGSAPANELEGLLDNTQLLYTRGRLRLAQGQLEEALEDLLEAGQRCMQVTGENPSVLPWRSEAALALTGLGQNTEARRLAHEELAIARRFGAPRALGISLRAAGLVEGGGDGLHLLEEASDALAGSGARVEHARALCELGAALRRAGRRADAREPLRQALDLAARTGASLVADRARGELLAAGARPRRDRIEGRDALTASEWRVAKLAADGLSNSEIAQSLFVARRTVETHLTHIYRKLDIASRAELAATLESNEPPIQAT